MVRRRMIVVDGKASFSCPKCGGFPVDVARSFDGHDVGKTPVCLCGVVPQVGRHEAQRSALYAATIAREYPRLVEHEEPAKAMREAIERAELVVKVWEEVVK